MESAVASSSAPIFVRKLWDLVENPSVDYLISWSKVGPHHWTWHMRSLRLFIHLLNKRACLLQSTFVVEHS